MSITGTYVVRGGKLVKVSDEIPSIGGSTSDLCSFKRPYMETHMDDHPIHIASRGQKAKELKKRGLVEKSMPRGGWNVPTGRRQKDGT